MAVDARIVRLFTIPAGVDFLECFVRSLLAGKIIPGFPLADDPLSLASARIFVPTQRAARALTSELARQNPARAALLPQILPLGTLADAQANPLFDEATAPGFRAVPELEAVSELERRLVLSHLILKWGEAVRQAICYVDENGNFVTDDKEPFLVAHAPGQAFHLAGELGELIDEMTLEGIAPETLRSLVPEEFDRYWSITLEFLDIALQRWPEYLLQRGRADRSATYIRLVDAEVRRLKAQPPATPWIVAGSTGTNPATSRLIGAISRLPNGAVVLPGLDQELHHASWSMLAPATHAQSESASEGLSGHPQAALAQLLRRLGVERTEVRALAAPQAAIAQRIGFLSQALRPAQTTDRWAAYRAQAPTSLGSALDDVTVVEADNERLEALAIAIAMRRVLETPGKTAALITPDRRLTQRVRCELERWGIEVEDSGGEGLEELPAGVFARLVLTLSARPDGAALAGLLNHPFTRLGYQDDVFARVARQTIVALAHGPRFEWERLESAVEAAQQAAQGRDAHRARAAIDEQDWRQIVELMERLRSALAPLRQIGPKGSPRGWFDAHRRSLDLIRAGFETPTGESGFSARTAVNDSDCATPDSIALEHLFDALAATPDIALDLDLPSYAALFETVAGEIRAPTRNRSHPRLTILGLLEARLMPADLKILAGLDETVWPPAAQVGAFLNRPMRQTLGLGLPERRIGQTAHDFVEAMGAGEVLITRLRKRNGAPTIPSRFLQRMSALAGSLWDECLRRGENLLQLAQAIDRPAQVRPVDRPRPRPPLILRPTRLSVTQIETWRRDPYAIYARQILGLTRFDDVGADGGAADIGSRLHDVIAEFHKQRERVNSDGAAPQTIVALASHKFADLKEDIAFMTFYWPRIMASLHAFVIWDEKRRHDARLIATETSGRLDIDLVDGSVFTLTARADRIELDADGAATIADYKSGAVPSVGQIEAGFSPQMTLEAAMVERGAFQGFPRGAHVRAALYLKLMGPQGLESRPVGQGKNQIPLQELSAEHFKGLVELANQFRNPDTPYIARPFPQFINRFGEYDHLARVKEWIAEGEE